MAQGTKVSQRASKTEAVSGSAATRQAEPPRLGARPEPKGNGKNPNAARRVRAS